MVSLMGQNLANLERNLVGEVIWMLLVQTGKCCSTNAIDLVAFNCREWELEEQFGEEMLTFVEDSRMGGAREVWNC